jgi:hypothetical protein
MPKTPPAPGAKPTGGAKASVVVEFAFERDTKNTRRFQEVVADGASPVVGTLYVKNTPGITDSDRIRVTIQAV